MNSPIVAGDLTKFLLPQPALQDGKTYSRKYICALDPLVILGLVVVGLQSYIVDFDKETVNSRGIPIVINCPCLQGRDKDVKPHKAYLDGSFQLPPRPFWRR